MSATPSFERCVPRAGWALLALVAVLSLFLAVVVPYHATDALVYGQWSVRIGQTGHWNFPQIGSPPYSRPLFYAPQGWLWWLLGQHEWLGRLLSLSFFVLLVWAMAALARLRELPSAARGALLVLLLLLACPNVLEQAFAGQTDVPVAAMVALTGALLWCRRPSTATALLLVGAACGAVLAKATALPALGGLMLAHLIGERETLLARVRDGVVPVAVGTGLGLLYDGLEGRHFGVSIHTLITSAAGGGSAPSLGFTHPAAGMPSTVDAPSRPGAVLRAEWLGPYLRLLVAFAIVYALLRVLRLAHRSAVPAAVAVAAAIYWLGPPLISGAPGSGSSPTANGAAAVLASLILIPVLLAARWAPDEAVADPRTLGRLLVWGVVPLLAWGRYGILGDSRTVSPAWPGLFLLMAVTLSTALGGLRVRRGVLAPAALALVVALGVLDLRHLDAIGTRLDGSVSLVRGLRDLPPSAWTHPERARAAADPQLAGLLNATRAAAGPHGRVVANDGRLVFFLTDRLQVVAPLPAGCSLVRPPVTLSLLTATFGAAEYAQYRRLARCPGGRLHQQASQFGSYAVASVR